uniref:Uncharacterized protein n=1 Tax=Romanomermis culicivorax TaxID=13658 RepID=A0A915I8F5_ROMCU
MFDLFRQSNGEKTSHQQLQQNVMKNAFSNVLEASKSKIFGARYRTTLPPPFIAQVQHPPPPTPTGNGPAATKYVSTPQGVVPSLLNGGSGTGSASRSFLTGSINTNGKPASINLATNVGPFNNWATAPAPPHGALQSKVFNPTIGPPNAHPSKVANVPGVYGAVFNLTAGNVLASNGNFAAFSSKKSPGSANVINLSKNQPNYVTNQDFACYAAPQYRQNSNLISMIEQQPQQTAAQNLNLNINLNMNASGYFHLREDFKKRDGDLLQKMDHFINSTNGNEDEILLARANEKPLTVMNESDLTEKA